MAFKIYNTMTRKKETVKPLKGKLVRMYTCGPTVYDFAHVGNLRTYVNEDLLKRYLIWKGFKVKHVMNITDVGHLTDNADQGEDKMVLAERREGKTAWEIAKFYEKAFTADLHALNIIPADILCRATGHINEQIELIKKLERKGYTYVLPDGVYFDTAKLKGYGKLARLDVKGLKAGARVEIVAGKKSPTDFALWKITPHGVKRHMEWDSPWGRGFPGWHIECSAMSMKYLGPSFDLHCGGVDHIPVHHTNEIAQSEAATGKRFVKYWWHGEFLNIGGRRMGKSERNLVRLKDLVDNGFTARQLHLFFLQAHYRTQQMFTEDALRNAAATLVKLDEFMERLREYKNEIRNSPEARDYVRASLKEFERALDDDLNVPLMWSSLHGFVGVVNRLIDGKKISTNDAKIIYEAMMDFDRVLGVLQKEEKKISAKVKELTEERETLRQQKRFKEADEIRKILLEEYGVEIQDTPEGPKARFVR